MKPKITTISSSEAIEFAERIARIKRERREASSVRWTTNGANEDDMKPATFKLKRNV